MANTNESSSPFFSGNIGDAIVHSKSQNCPLVVAIHGDDNDSKRLDGETWTNEQVIALLGKESVALKLLWNTDDAKNFYSIYPVLNVPTVYIISPTNGSPLKVLTGFFDSQSFLNSFNESKELLKKGNTAPATPSPIVPSSPVTPPTQPFNSNNNAQPAVNTQSGTLSKEEQQRRMREKLEEIKRQKEEEERKAEKEREMARRQSGKELQKTVTQVKQNQQAKDIQERQREKEEEKLARQKVKEQLERDKAERKARMEQSKPVQPAPTAKIPKTSHNTAEVAFKMTDGSTIRKEFQPNDTVQDLYNFVKQNSTLRSFELSTSFPRKVLGAHDMNKTLLECDLVPNGTIMVMSFDTAPSHSSPSLATAGLMDTAYNYWSWMYSGVTGWIWGSALPPNSQMQQSNGPQPINASRQPPSPTNTTQRRNGPRIGTLGTLSSDDPDKNSYWNGNSTQQQ